MLVHTVFFWMKKNAPKGAAKQTMKDALKYLNTPTVSQIGRASCRERVYVLV